MSAALGGVALLGCASFVQAGDLPVPTSGELVEEYVIPDPLQEQPSTPAALAAQASQPQASGAAPRSQALPGGASPFTATESARPNLAALSRYRLASTPDMFGDFFGRGGTITASDGLATAGAFTITGQIDVPLAGGARGLKVGEHNKALPVDRVYFNYNHYHNALQFRARGANPGPGPGTPFAAARDLSLDRYTLGLEKTFLCGLGSVEVRMPLTGGYDFDFHSGSPNGIVTAEGEHIGNLSIIPKLLLYEDEFNALAVGLAVETPTGSDAAARVGSVNYRIENEAVHLHPYLGFTSQGAENFFVNAFAQIDLATNGNPVEFAAATTPPAAGAFGVYDEQTLLHFDLSVGQWLYRDPCAPLVTGLAALVEWHGVIALEDTDVVSGALATAFVPGATLDLRNPANRFEVFNVTTGVHVELAQDTTLRVGGVFPLRNSDNRFFDAEVIGQVSRRF